MILKRLFKKNQIIITALAVMIAIAGYLELFRTPVRSKRRWGKRGECRNRQSGTFGYLGRRSGDRRRDCKQ